MKKIIYAFLSFIIMTSPLYILAGKATALGPNLISNPSAETVNPANNTLAIDWTTEAWGTNTQKFTYESTAANVSEGTKSLYVQLLTRNSGDAKWVHKEVAVTPSTSYTFSNDYKANITSEIVVQTKTTAGSYTYQSLGTPTASVSSWKKNNIVFTTTANAKTITVFHLIKKVGWLYTDNYSLALTNGTSTPTAPTVSITSPLANATVSGAAVTLSATAASAGSSVAGVQFYVDNVAVGNEDTSAPYQATWNSTTATNGTHVLTAKARSANGLSTTSSGVNVTVTNSVLPTISISTPQNGALVTGNTVFDTVTTNAASVQFYVDGNAFGSLDTQSPFQATVDTTVFTNGTHTLYAIAKSSSGQTATSTTVNFVVNNSSVVTPSTNLIANNSAETAESATKPANWNSGSWGTNTPAFTYETDAQDGTKSVKTTITSFTNGDAKWFFTPVSVTAGTTYEYSHYYKSSTSTDILAQYTDASGNVTYGWLATVPASTAWQRYAVSITPPAGTQKLTVLHVLYAVGTLQLDNAFLGLPAVTTPDTATIKNGSVETESSANSATPKGWSTGKWGTNTALFEYLTTEGYSGTKSLKLTMTSYTDGDAKWFFDPISTLTSGKMYRFSTKYKTNTIPKAVAQFNKTDGTTQYFGMPNPQPNGTTNWQSYSDTFTVPLNTSNVTVFFMLNSVGWVQLDDQTITPYTPTGFNRPLLSLTFDDGFEDNNVTVLPMTDAYGFKTTQCYATQFVKEAPANPGLVLQFKNAGHEICSHTETHPFLTSLNTTQLENELANSQAYLQSIIGGPVPNFASPYGNYDAAVNNVIKKYYRSHRTVDEGFNSKDNFDIYRIRVQNILSNTTAAQVQAWIAQAQATNTWLVLVYHKVSNTDVGQFDSYTADFAQQLQAIAASGITVKTYGAALDEVTAQL